MHGVDDSFLSMPSRLTERVDGMTRKSCNLEVTGWEEEEEEVVEGVLCEIGADLVAVDKRLLKPDQFSSPVFLYFLFSLR